MAGVCQGDPANVTVDETGYLHLRIAHAGGTWSASELFTTDELGFGTYQWQVEGPIDTYDKNVVLGLFPYGPEAGLGGDGTNEIDIEYSRWGQANGPNGDFTVYPATGTTIGELSYSFTLSGLASTSRLSWSDTGVIEALFDGFEPLVTSSAPVKTWTYMPSQPSKNIPQAALPLGINLWCFDSPPSDANPVEIVIRSFEFVPQGAAAGAGGMAGGASSTGGASAGAGAGGRRGSAGSGQGGASPVSRGGRPGIAGAATNAGAAAGALGAEASGQGGAAGAETSGGAPSSGGLGPGASEGGRSTGGRSSVSGGRASSDGAAPVTTRSSGCDCSLASEGGTLGYLGGTWLPALAWLVRHRSRRRRSAA